MVIEARLLVVDMFRLRNRWSLCRRTCVGPAMLWYRVAFLSIAPVIRSSDCVAAWEEQLVKPIEAVFFGDWVSSFLASTSIGWAALFTTTSPSFYRVGCLISLISLIFCYAIANKHC